MHLQSLQSIFRWLLHCSFFCCKPSSWTLKLLKVLRIEKTVRNTNHHTWLLIWKYCNTPPIHIAIHLQLYCSTVGALEHSGKGTTFNTPSICIAIRLPFVSQCWGVPGVQWDRVYGTDVDQIGPNMTKMDQLGQVGRRFAVFCLLRFRHLWWTWTKLVQHSFHSAPCTPEIRLPFVGDGPNTFSESYDFIKHRCNWVLLVLTEFRRRSSVSSSRLILCAKANSPSSLQNSPSLGHNSVSSLIRNSTLETVFSDCPSPNLYCKALGEMLMVGVTGMCPPMSLRSWSVSLPKGRLGSQAQSKWNGSRRRSKMRRGQRSEWRWRRLQFPRWRLSPYSAKSEPRKQWSLNLCLRCPSR